MSRVTCHVKDGVVMETRHDHGARILSLLRSLWTNQRWVLRPVDQPEASITWGSSPSSLRAAGWSWTSCSCARASSCSPRRRPRCAARRSGHQTQSAQDPCNIHAQYYLVLHPTLNKRLYGGWRQSYYEKEKLPTSKEPISCVWGEVCCTVVWCAMVWLMFVYFLAVCLIEFWSRKTPNDQTIDC